MEKSRVIPMMVSPSCEGKENRELMGGMETGAWGFELRVSIPSEAE
jgi:hypothetical protein